MARPLRSAAAVLGAGLVVLLAACAPEGPPEPTGAPRPPVALPAAPGPVIAVGTVLQREGEEPMLCLGMIAESWPPQCTGPEIAGWDWSTAPQPYESASGVTWGGFVVAGRWDGTVFALAEPPLSPGDYTPPPVEPDPRRDPANPGPGDEARLNRINDELYAPPWQGAIGLLYALPENGYLWATVLYDDGTIQRALDEAYGAGTVIVVSAMRDA